MPSLLCRRILFWTILPILVCTIIAEATLHLAPRRYIYSGFDSSTLKTAYWALPKIVHPSTTGDDDSWYPMKMAMGAFARSHKADIYRSTFFNQKFPVGTRPKFQYPPSSLLLIEPLNYLHLLKPDDGFLNGTGAVTLVLNAILLGAMAYYVFARFRQSDAPNYPERWRRADPLWLAGLAVAMGFVFYPITQGFHLGQIQIWLNLAMTLACYLWITGRVTLSGALVAAICAVKPQLSLLLIWALLWRNWSFVKGFLALGVPIAVISLARYGWHNHVEYLSVLSYLSRHGESYVHNASMNGLLHRLFFEGDNLQFTYAYELAPYDPFVYWASTATFAFFIAAALLPALLRRGQKATVLDLGAAVTCFTIGSPVAWDHHYGLLLPFFILLLAGILHGPACRERTTKIVLLVISWTLVANSMTFFNLFADSYLNVLESYRFFGGIILAVLLWRPPAHDEPVYLTHSHQPVEGYSSLI